MIHICTIWLLLSFLDLIRNVGDKLLHCGAECTHLVELIHEEASTVELVLLNVEIVCILNFLFEVDPGEEVVEYHYNTRDSQRSNLKFLLFNMNLQDINWNLRTVHVKCNHQEEARNCKQTAEFVGPSKLFRKLILFYSELQIIQLLQELLTLHLVILEVVLWI